MKLKLNEPKVITFLIAVLLAVVAVILFLTPTTQVYAIWVMLVAFVLLVAGNMVKGL